MSRIIGIALAAAMGVLAFAATGCGNVRDGGPQVATPSKGSASEAPASRPAISAATGRQLIAMLQDDATRLKAFRELLRRNKEEDYIEVDSAEAIRCPQGDGAEPIWIVLRNFTHRFVPGEEGAWDETYNGYKVEKPDQLFEDANNPPQCPLPPHGKFERRDNLVIHAFTDDGNSFMVVDGHNMLDEGVIEDINGDGLIERADFIRYGIEGVRCAKVMRVEQVGVRTRFLLAVLYNFGEKEDWDYRFTDSDNDGLWEIEFGPVTGDTIKPKAVFRWDSKAQAYVGPAGGKGDHFRVLPMKSESDHWDVLKKTCTGLAHFPADPDATQRTQPAAGKVEDGSHDDARVKAEPPPPKPYKYASLAGMDDDQLGHYMGKGNQLEDFREGRQVIETHLPRGFWELPPRQAALAFAEVNRTDAHRRVFRLAIDDRDGAKPPAACQVRFNWQSSRRRFSRDGAFLLRVDPDGSSVASAGSLGQGDVFNTVVAPPIYDLRRIDVPYLEVRHLADVIWYLRRLRSWEIIGPTREGLSSAMRGMSYSTDDGNGTLRMVWPGGGEITAEGKAWATNAVSQGWFGPYGPDALTNLADYLLTEVLPKKIGRGWDEQAPPAARLALRGRETEIGRTGTAAQPSLQEIERLQVEQTHRQTGRLIDLFSRDQSMLSFEMARYVAAAAGDYVMADYLPQLERIAAKAPAGGELRQAAELAIKKIRSASDHQKLLDWACSDADGWQWALGRLRKLDTKRYVAALVYWMKQADEEWVRKCYYALRKEDPNAANDPALQIPPPSRPGLSASAKRNLKKVLAIKDLHGRIDALVKLAKNPKGEWALQSAALECLVPDDDPLKYPDPKVDEAMLKLLGEDSLLMHACDALARRGRVEYFDRIAELLSGDRNFQSAYWVLGSLVRLANGQSAGRPGALDPAKMRDMHEKLLKIVRSQFNETFQSVDVLGLLVYAVDLRELKGDLERMATSGPEDYEGEMGTSLSGRPKAVEGRYHMPRKVLAIWNEQHAPTRAKLLIALWREHGKEFGGLAAGRIQQQLRDLAPAVKGDDARGVLAFLDWCEDHAAEIMPDESGKLEWEIGKFVRKTIVP
jgi:hypothetical protein